MIQIKSGNAEFVQWETGQRVTVSDEQCTHAHFELLRKSYRALSVEREGDEFRVPDELLAQSGTLRVNLVDVTEDAATVVARADFNIRAAQKPTDYTPDASEVVTIKALEERIREAVEASEAAVSNAQQAVETANAVTDDLIEKRDSGFFKGEPGEPGFSPTAKVERTAGGVKVTVTDKDGTTTATVNDGAKGDPGEDGYSPTAKVERVEGGAVVTMTDESGTTTAQVRDGAPGAPGKTPVRGVDYWTAADRAPIEQATADANAAATNANQVASSLSGEIAESRAATRAANSAASAANTAAANADAAVAAIPDTIAQQFVVVDAMPANPVVGLVYMVRE